MKKTTTKKLPVMIRYEGKAKGNWHPDDLVAVFPTEPATHDRTTMVCYSRVGQHSSCSPEYVRTTKPATTEQVKVMLKELSAVGYKNLKVVSRASATHSAQRRRTRY